MDTKLKKSRIAGTYAGSVILLISAVICSVGISVGLTLNVYESYINYEVVKESSREVLNSFISMDLAVVTLSGIIALVALILITICAGKRNQDGSMHYTWFDKIYTEFKLTAGIGLTVILCLAIDMLSGVLINSSFGNFVMKKLSINTSTWYEQYSSYGFGAGILPEWFVVMIFLAIIIVIVIFLIALYISIVKELKDHSFLKSFLIVKLVRSLANNIAKTEKTDVLVLVSLIVGAVISSTVFGSIVVIILILVFVPKLLNQYKEIKKGVNKVTNGELSYKIPVTSKTDLGRLASDINDISSATEIAIENELKHQKMKTDLISNVSHDLKTPLTSMISYVDLLKREGLDSENAEEYLRILDEKTKRLKNLTENLFEAAKASSGEIPVELNNIDMKAIVRQSVAELEENLNGNNLEIIETLHTDCTTVIADGQLLWRIIENLLVNVSKYALPCSRVYVDIYERENQIILEIKNMSKERLNISVDELMERFTRGDESRNTEGSGLGLGIARDLTSLMNGNFEISIDGDLFKAKVTLPKGE